MRATEDNCRPMVGIAPLIAFTYPSNPSIHPICARNICSTRHDRVGWALLLCLTWRSRSMNVLWLWASGTFLHLLARHVTTIAELQLLVVWDMLVEKRFMVKEIEFPFLSCYHNLCFRCLLSFVAVVVSVVTSSLGWLWANSSTDCADAARGIAWLSSAI